MRKVGEFSLQLVAAAAALVAAQFAEPAMAQTTTWNLYNTFPVATAPNVMGVQKILDTIQQQTNGALKINMHLAGSLPIKAETMTQAVADNIVQMGDDAFFQGNVPVAGLLRLPLLIHNYDEFLKAEAIMMPYIVEAYDAKGVVVLGEYAYPLQYPFSIRKLTSLADLKGQKIRPTSPEQGEFVKRFGGISISAGAAEVTTALERGTFDGVITASAVGGKGWKDFLKYVYAMPLNYGNSIIIVNKGSFEAMSPEIQATVRKVVQDNTKQINDTLNSQNDDATKELVAGGMTLTQPTAEDSDAALKLMTSYWSEWAQQRGPKAVEALAKVRAALGR
jgi:TRAP-type C4-dicarboxylate transport system substrate-binding protein